MLSRADRDGTLRLVEYWQRGFGRQVRLRREPVPFRMLRSYAGKKPLLPVRVDGVLDPYSFDRVPDDFELRWLFSEDDEPVYVPGAEGIGCKSWPGSSTWCGPVRGAGMPDD